MKRLVTLSTNCIKSITAALTIAIAGYCNLLCDHRWIGAALFSFGLIYVCKYKLNLFTGMAGYVTLRKTPSFIVSVAVNLVSAFAVGRVLSCNHKAVEFASALIVAKTDNNIVTTLISSIMCGVLIFLAVDYYKKFTSIIGIVFAIPIFVLCGFDHAVADAFYIGVAGEINESPVLFLLTVTVGNIAGSTLMRFLLYLSEKGQNESRNV